MSSLKNLFLIASTMLGTAFAADSMVINDFENAQDLAAWKALDGKSTFMELNADPAFITSGKASAKVTFPARGEGESRWPRFTMPTKPRPCGTDWANYDELTADIINPGSGEIQLHFSITAADKTVYKKHNYKIAPGRTTIVWPLQEAVRGKPVVSIMLFQSDPPESYTFYLDNMQLRVNPELLAGRIDELLRRMETEVTDSAWKNGGKKPQFDQLKRNLAELRTNRKSALDNSAAFAALKKDYENLKPELYAVLQNHAVARFDRAFAGKDWGYGWTHGAKKVFRETLPFDSLIGGGVELSLARREVESFQVVLRSKKSIEEVNVTIGELRNPENNAVIPAEQLMVMPVGYVKSLPTPYPVEKVTWWPDPLLPFLKTFTLDANVWQPVWIDVAATVETLPGTYRGTVTVSGKNVADIQVPVAVRVWNFALPASPTQPQLFNYSTDFNHAVYTTDQDAFKQFCDYKEGKINEDKLGKEARRLRQLELDTENILLAHHITPTQIYAASRPLRNDDAKRWLEHGGNTYCTTYLTPRPVKKGELYPSWLLKRALATLDKTVPELKAAGIYDRAYLYCFDEISENQFFAAQTMLAEIKKHYPDLPTVTTAFDPDFGRANGLSEVIDVWCPQVESFVKYLDRIRAEQKAGKKVWYYSCMWDPGMDFLLEKPATAPRLLLGLAQHKYGSDGFLYYNVFHGQSKQNRISTGPLTEHNGRSYLDFNGCGLLIYPGANGPLPCIRLKALRDGIEDFEYWRLLKILDAKAPQLSTADAAELKSLINIPSEVMADLEHYDFTGDKLAAARQKAGELLSKYSALLDN